MNSANLPEAILKKLIAVIKALTDVHSIYWIGIRTNEHWEITLLIVSKSYINDPKYFMGKIFSKMNQKVKIFSIHYTLNEIENRLTEGDNFLSLVLNENNRIFQESPLFLTGYNNHPIMFQRIQERWESRMSKAEYFNSKLDVSDDNYSEPAKLLLADQAITQTCAALLWVYWEYKPPVFDLDYMIHLCQNFSKSIKIVLPKHSFRSQRVYNLICHAQFNLNYKSLQHISIEDGYYASDLAFKFLRAVRVEGKKRLTELAKVHNI
ncbi:hypothetical protein [Zunongwangia atlantica]|uniref:Uncharacterized protein n=1 Tax=Zunongwangia atlantica 22II14-10F7 TaxID=1185767 RepID=A0A1Y1SZA5_9FLAO|nr:hypothetical protein [Zunongwangia atlantica]ORL43573.1 hypothetical protein IIF7_20116 [Zunongwangia atlantica 22II14-10F7]